MFRVSVKTIVGDGRSTSFWSDRWINGKTIQDLAPALMPFVKKRGWRTRSVHEALQGNAWLLDVVGGLPALALWQFLMLWDTIMEMQLTPDQPDMHIWTPCPSGTYTSKSAYQRFLVGAIDFEPYKWLWWCWAPLKVKIFIWLATWKRCWTADRLERRGLPHPERCPLCGQEPETIDHLLTSCVFAREIWFQVLRWANLQMLVPMQEDTSFQAWWRRANRRDAKEHSKGLNTLIMLVFWEVWKHRNRCVFDGVRPCTTSLIQVIRQEANLWALAGAGKLRPLL